MTHEEIKIAIKRLRAIEPSDYVGNIMEVVWELMGGMVSGVELRDTIVALLRQADPDTHIALPVDAEGGVIRIGDKAEHCYNGRWGEPFEIVELRLRPSGWMVSGENGAAVIAETCRHHHKPTVEDMLRDFAYCLEDGATEQSMDELVGEYAKKLQLKEAMTE
jgi:hypothetical protein